MIEAREYQPQDGPGYVEVHNSVWSGDLAIDIEIWERWCRQPTTAAIALEDGKVVGAVPFHLRDFVVRPGLVIRAAFEYSVCVYERLRSQGVGSKMMAAARQFLPAQADVMMVYRGGERSPGYRFYARTAHYDTVFYRNLVWQAPNGRVADGVRFCDAEEFLNREGEVLDVFVSAYGCFGGYPQRVPGYHARAFNSIQYAELKSDFYFALAEDDDGLAGYALLARWVKGENLQIAEMATRGGDQAIAHGLLMAAATQAAELGTSLTISGPDDGLYCGLARSLSFSGRTRAEGSMFIMAHLLDAPDLAQKTLRQMPELAGMRIEAFTPEADYLLQDPPASAKTITLEMKEDHLTRLLLCQLDLQSAIREHRVTAYGAGDGDIAALARAFPYCHWEYHPLDYI